MRVSKSLCFLGFHAWEVERTGSVPGAHVRQRYCRRCGQEVIDYDVYDFEAWEEWVEKVTDNRIPEEVSA